MTGPFPFETRLHREALSVHRPHHTSVADPWVTDPEKVKASHIWWEWDSDTAPTKYKAWLRNPTNTAWIFLSAWHMGQTYAEGEVPVADADGYFLPATVEGGESGGGGPHASTHYEGGDDEVDITQLGGFSGDADEVLHGDGTWSEPSSGAITQAYEGYNTIGASQENVSSNRVWMKQVVLANACLITNIEAHIDSGNGTDNVDGWSVGLYSDSAGSPNRLLAHSQGPGASLLLDNTAGAGGGDTGRWFGMPLGYWVAAGTYWLAVGSMEAVGSLRIYKDGSGSDKYYDSGGAWYVDAGFYTVNNTTDRYSIRANTIR